MFLFIFKKFNWNYDYKLRWHCIFFLYIHIHISHYIILNTVSEIAFWRIILSKSYLTEIPLIILLSKILKSDEQIFFIDLSSNFALSLRFNWDFCHEGIKYDNLKNQLINDLLFEKTRILVFYLDYAIVSWFIL